MVSMLDEAHADTANVSIDSMAKRGMALPTKDRRVATLLTFCKCRPPTMSPFASLNHLLSWIKPPASRTATLLT